MDGKTVHPSTLVVVKGNLSTPVPSLRWYEQEGSQHENRKESWGPSDEGPKQNCDDSCDEQSSSVSWQEQQAPEQIGLFLNLEERRGPFGSQQKECPP